MRLAEGFVVHSRDSAEHNQLQPSQTDGEQSTGPHFCSSFLATMHKKMRQKDQQSEHDVQLSLKIDKQLLSNAATVIISQMVAIVGEKRTIPVYIARLS